MLNSYKLSSDAVPRVSKKAVMVAKIRAEIRSSHKEKDGTLSKRAAIEGTNSALKRAHGVGKLAVSGLIKCNLNFGLKIIGHNIKQMIRCLQNKAKKALDTLSAHQVTVKSNLPNRIGDTCVLL